MNVYPNSFDTMYMYFILQTQFSDFKKKSSAIPQLQNLKNIYMHFIAAFIRLFFHGPPKEIIY